MAVIVVFVFCATTGEIHARLQGPPHGVASPAPSLRLLRFSPDGHYILAQDESAVMVLTAQPLAILFRAPAENAGAAWFTPDSQQLVFVTSATSANSQRIVLVGPPAHVERWDIANHARMQSTEVRLPPCDTEVLSPDGRALACVDFGGTLRLIDIRRGETILEVKQFGRQKVSGDLLHPRGYSVWGDPGAADIDFSPDGRFVIAAPDGMKSDGSAVGFDLRQRKPIKLTGSLRDLPRRVWAFIAPERVLLAELDLEDPTVTAALVAFPSGKVLLKSKIPAGGVLSPATDPGFVLIHPFGLYAFYDPQAKRTAAVEYRTGEVIISETPALDVFGNHYVAQLPSGEIGLYERGKLAPAATVRLDTR
jgi:hypothetical protein